MIGNAWVMFVVSELFLVMSLTFFKLTVRSPDVAIFDLGVWLCSVVAIWTFGRTLTQFDLGSITALWLGCAVILVSLMSLFFLNETFTLWKVISIVMTTLGVTGLIISMR